MRTVRKPKIFQRCGQQDLDSISWIISETTCDWYGGTPDFVPAGIGICSMSPKAHEASVPVHNGQISDSTQEDTADDFVFAPAVHSACRCSFRVAAGADRVHGVPFARSNPCVQTTANQYVGNGGLNLTLSRDILKFIPRRSGGRFRGDDNNNNSTGGGHGRSRLPALTSAIPAADMGEAVNSEWKMENEHGCIFRKQKSKRQPTGCLLSKKRGMALRNFAIVSKFLREILLQPCGTTNLQKSSCNSGFSTFCCQAPDMGKIIILHAKQLN